MPSVGEQFTVLTANSIINSGLSLGGTAASLFDLIVGSNSLVLQAISPTFPGDFNRDGIVDAADYVVWSTTEGTSQSYDVWRTNFGQYVCAINCVGSGAGRGNGISASTNARVPEPSSWVFLSFGIAVAFSHRTFAGTFCSVDWRYNLAS
jgi:hypothetical protein